MTPKHSRIFKFLLRAIITIAALYLTFQQIPVSEIVPLMQQSEWPMMVLALALVHLSQFMSSQRMRVYLKSHGGDLPSLPSLQLQYIGGLFNVFLPGGVGGDGYKAWWLKHYVRGTLKHNIYLMIANRLNGLWGLGVLTCGMMLFSEKVTTLLPFATLLIIAVIVLGSAVYHLLAWKLCKETLRTQYQAGIYSFLLQGSLIVMAWCLHRSLMPEDVNAVEYLILFQISCVVSMLPLTIGGIGLREMTFLHLSPLLGVSPQHGVALALAFTVLSLTIPVIGAMVYAIWKPTHKTPMEGGE
jgi:uncharacterized membrane protein YbhN (UPF0104 family)